MSRKTKKTAGGREGKDTWCMREERNLEEIILSGEEYARWKKEVEDFPIRGYKYPDFDYRAEFSTVNQYLREYLQPYETLDVEDVHVEVEDDDVLLKYCEHKTESEGEPKPCNLLESSYCEPSTRKKFKIVCKLKNDLFCETETRDKCKRCRINREGELASKAKKIKVYDLRLCNHAASVEFSYQYFRCDRKQEALRTLPGVNSRSGSRPVRFSSRLSEKIKEELVKINKPKRNNGISQYVSEACSIPFDTITRWREKDASECKKEMEQRQFKQNFSEDTGGAAGEGVNEIGTFSHMISGRTHVFACKRMDDRLEKIQDIYSLTEWNYIRDPIRFRNATPRRPVAFRIPAYRFWNIAYDVAAQITQDCPTNLMATLLVCRFLWHSMRSEPAHDQYQSPFAFEYCVKERLETPLETLLSEREYRFYSVACKELESVPVQDRVFFFDNLLWESGRTISRDNLPDSVKLWLDTCEEYAREKGLCFRKAHAVQVDIANEPKMQNLCVAINQCDLTSTEIIKRLLYYNPDVVPKGGNNLYEENARILFTPGGEFDYENGIVQAATIDRLLEMIKEGLLE